MKFKKWRKSRACSCKDCARACKIKPGWFLPGEAEKAAKLMGMPLKKFAQKYLTIDYFTLEVNALQPAIKVSYSEKDYIPMGLNSGRCVFLTEDDKCKIHAAKPYECSASLICGRTGPKHTDVGEQWDNDKHQEQIAELFDIPRPKLKAKQSAARLLSQLDVIF